MYQAIVFLPLIGCLIAAAISLVGARARHPGGLPPPGAENHALDHGPHHHAPAISGGAVVHASHHEAESHEPAAAGSRAAELVTTGLLCVSALLSWVAFVYV